jgi:hypothetical protein
MYGDVMYDTNMLFAFIIGGLTFLAVNNFFRKDGPWAKRNRIAALARVRSNQMRRKWNSGNDEEENTAVRSSAMVILLIVLIMTIISAVLG